MTTSTSTVQILNTFWNREVLPMATEAEVARYRAYFAALDEGGTELDAQFARATVQQQQLVRDAAEAAAPVWATFSTMSGGEGKWYIRQHEAVTMAEIREKTRLYDFQQALNS